MKKSRALCILAMLCDVFYVDAREGEGGAI